MHVKGLQSLFLQSPKLNQLNILKEIAADSHITQAELATRCSLSVAMVNNYMKELCASGLMEYHRKSTKSVTYHLTPSGTQNLQALQSDLINEMVAMFVAAKEQIRTRIMRQAQAGIERVVLFGSGHLAQLVFHALEVTGLNILGICDDNIEVIGSEFCGREILSASQIRFLAPDAVIVADSVRTEEICSSLISLSERGVVVIRLDKYSENKPAEIRKTDLPLEPSDSLKSDRMPL
jgi:predicted transcriptional regulator